MDGELGVILLGDVIVDFLKVTRPSFFFWGVGYHPTLKLYGIPHLYFYRKSNT